MKNTEPIRVFTNILLLATWVALYVGCSVRSTKSTNQDSLQSHRFAATASNAEGSPNKASGAGLDAELTTYSYPFPVKVFSFESQKQALKMAYMDLVPISANGRAVVLLHGKHFASNYWEKTAQALAEHGYRVIMPDQIGFGKSTKPESYQYSFQQLARNTRELVDELGLKKVVIIGHSMGGELAVRFALMYPQTTEKLVLVNPTGLEDANSLVSYHTIDELYHIELQKDPAELKEYATKSYFGGTWRPEYDRLLEIQTGWMQNQDYNLIAWNAALTSDMMLTQPIVFELAKISSPTLLIIGQRDRSSIGKELVPPQVALKMGDYPKLGKNAAKAIAGAQLVELSTAGHLPQIEAFTPFIEAVLRFLSGSSKK